MRSDLALPFAEGPASASSPSEDVRWAAKARELVMQEVEGSSVSSKAWWDVITHSQNVQLTNLQLYREFLGEMQCDVPFHLRKVSPSPLSGNVHDGNGRRCCGVLDPIEVAAPPTTLWRDARRPHKETATVPKDLMQGRTSVLSTPERRREVEGEAPLLRSASSSVASAATPLMSSQSALDGVFFEALLSQELHLSLWQSCAAPEETLQSLLQEVQQLDCESCAEDAALRFLNATRYSEQRAYKRRRDEIDSSLRKTRDKIAAMEKFLRIGSAELVPAKVQVGARLLSCIRD